MQLEDLRIFVATVETGSFTAAANKLLLSKQFVSRRVMALEASLGVRLLTRNTRKLSVTDLGYELYDRAQRILGEIAEAEQAMSSGRAEPRGLFKVSAPMSFGMVHLSPLIAEFLRTNPDVRFDVELSDRWVDLIGEGFDMAVRIGALADSTLIAHRLAELPMVACCSPGYRRRNGVPAAPADLRHHACLLYGQEARDGWEFTIDGARKTCEVHGPLRANNGELIRDAAVAGLGIALLPEFIVIDALRRGALDPILDSFVPSPIPVYAVHPQHRQSSVTIRALIAFLRQRLEKTLKTA